MDLSRLSPESRDAVIGRSGASPLPRNVDPRVPGIQAPRAPRFGPLAVFLAALAAVLLPLAAVILVARAVFW